MSVRTLAMLVVLGVVVGACGAADDAGESEDETTTTAPAETTTTTTADVTTTTEAATTTTAAGSRPPTGYGDYELPGTTTTTIDDAEPATTTTVSTTTTTTETTTTTTEATTTTSQDDEAGAVTIEIEGFSFGAPLEVPVGTQVTVVNRDSVAHTWTATDGAFDSGRLGSGASFTITLSDPGEYDFFCQFHPSMTGSITVSS